jgi:ATP-dependent protease ClpP protease subunit
MFKNIILLIAAAFLIVPNCYADDQQYQVKQPDHKVIERIEQNVGIIDIIGEIDGDTLATVNRGFAHFKQAHVIQIIIHINSLGGKLDAGYGIIQDMQEAEKTGLDVAVYVDHGEVCASMCTGIFANASTRMAAPDTLWIFHSPYVVLTPAEQTPENIAAAHDIVVESRKQMIRWYYAVDPDWTKHELMEHINTPNDPLVITGSHILHNRSREWITMEVND